MRTIKMHVVSVNPLVSQCFVQTACGLPSPSERARCPLAGQEVELVSLLPDALERKDLETDGVVVLVEHLDLSSVARLRHAMDAVVARPGIRLQVAIFRREDPEFKVSCLQCGQKLLISFDAVGRKGTCPRCQNVAVLPAQEAVARAALGLAEGAGLPIVTRSSRDSALAALARLLPGAAEDAGNGQEAPPAPAPSRGSGRPKLVIKRKG